MNVLGIHGGVTLGQHEPSAALIVDGKVLAVCEEERYLRNKSAYGYLPFYSIRACLKMANLSFEDIHLIVTPGITYDNFDIRIEDYIRHNFGSCPRLERVHHQMAHLCSAFYGSGLDESLVISLDSSGDGLSGMMGYATKSGGIKILTEIPTNNSLGRFYTMMTYYLGFMDGDEYKLMGLAPYGEPKVDLSAIIHPTGDSWSLDRDCIRSNPSLKSPFEPMYSSKVVKLLGETPRIPGSQVSSYQKDVASSTQHVFEKCLLNAVAHLRKRVPVCRNLCYAGGIALNCSANKLLLYSGHFDNVYVSPAASDRGLALGCAYYGAVQSGDQVQPVWNAYLGSSYSNDEIKKELDSNSLSYEKVDDPCEAGADLLFKEKIIGWYQGRSEAGARALGNRSILAKCEKEEMRDIVNARIKFREEFRPFAPSVLFEEAERYFISKGAALPSMSFTLDVMEAQRKNIPAVVHVDNTARVQTVRSSDNDLYYQLIKNYYRKSGVPVILNTSYNLKGQAIVETPRDALMTFFGCGMDALIMGNFLITKK